MFLVSPMSCFSVIAWQDAAVGVSLFALTKHFAAGDTQWSALDHVKFSITSIFGHKLNHS